MNKQKNVFGEEITECGYEPITGFYRDGTCHTEDNDIGVHTVCVRVTDQFLEYSKSQGNDLSTPMEEFGFPGLLAGDQWCLCAQRWMQAYNDGFAPKVVLAATNIKTLDIVPLEYLKEYALDLL